MGRHRQGGARRAWAQPAAPGSIPSRERHAAESLTGPSSSDSRAGLGQRPSLLATRCPCLRNSCSGLLLMLLRTASGSGCYLGPGAAMPPGARGSWVVGGRAARNTGSQQAPSCSHCFPGGHGRAVSVLTQHPPAIGTWAICGSHSAAGLWPGRRPGIFAGRARASSGRVRASVVQSSATSSCASELGLAVAHAPPLQPRGG